MKSKIENKIDIKMLGTLVESRAGRDQGHYFVVSAILSPEYVAIADGKKHLLAKPKKKKLRHIKVLPARFEAIGEKLESKKKVFDSEIFSAIKKWLEAQTKPE